jgi:SulP family sulfate permease
LNGPLFFADAGPFRSHLLDLVSANDATTVVLDLESTPEIDLDGADMLTKVHGQLADRGVRILLAHADAVELALLRRAGTLDAIGETNFFETVRAAVAAATSDVSQPGASAATEVDGSP